MSLLWEHDVNQLGYPIPREIHQTWRMKQIDLITSLRGMTLPIPKMGMGDAKQQQCFGDFLMNQNSTKTCIFSAAIFLEIYYPPKCD
jgi:hypothetical protein